MLSRNPESLSKCRGSRSFAVVACVVMVLAGTESARGHLSIIRQGPESAGTIEAGDRYGTVIVSGDFNNDGYFDLAVGTPMEDLTLGPTNVPAAGIVVISYGSKYGITHVGSHYLWIGLVGGSMSPSDQFGAALAVGDFNDDGYDDLAIGVPGKDNGAGEVRIAYGSATGLNGASFTHLSQAIGPGNHETGDGFGFSLAAGDFNNDGYADLAIGHPTEDLELVSGTLVNAGAVSIYFGSAAGLTTTGAFIITDEDTVSAAQAGAQFGFALAAGNFGGQPNDDLAIGIPGKNTSGPAVHGVIEILFGGPGGPAPSNTQFFSQVSFGGVNEAGDNFGAVLAAGDIDNDGFADLAMGVPLKDGGVTTNGGRVYVSYGSLFGLRTDNAQTFTQSLTGSEDLFGRAVAIGDWTGNGFGELAIGIPGKLSGAGRVDIYAGTANGVGSRIASETQEVLNEVSEANDNLGFALAFGAFAGGSRKGLAIGAPGEDYDPMPGVNVETTISNAGAVYIDMPWRQLQNLQSRTAMVVDCDGNIVFSQKPFTRHFIASTTKIMTTLLGCEATQPGCNPCVGLNDQYTFPAIFGGGNIVGGTLGGSMARWCAGEVTTFRDLLYTCMLISGNDSAFSIADHVFNPGNNCNAVNCADLVSFVSVMNNKAAALNMTMTQFQNPSGGGHGGGGWASNNWSTCWDMHLLSTFAMQNPLFRQIAGTLVYNFGRTFSVSPAPNLICTQGTNNASINTFCFPIPGGAGPDFPGGSGIKGGNLNGAHYVGSADHPGGRIYSYVYGCPSNPVRSTITINLLSMAANLGCDFPIAAPPPPKGSAVASRTLTTESGTSHSIPFPIDHEPDRAVVVQAALSEGMTSASATVAIRRHVRVELEPAERTVMSVSPFSSHAGILIKNVGDDTVVLNIDFNQPATSASQVLAPGQSYTIPAYAAMGIEPDATLEIHNGTSVAVAYLEIDDLGWAYDLELTEESGYFEARLTADMLMGEDSVEVIVVGQDDAPGSAIDIIIANTFDGDPDCDGTLDVSDIPAFVQALINPMNYEAEFPGCYIGSADRNRDGKIDGLDVQVFADELLGS